MEVIERIEPVPNAMFAIGGRKRLLALPGNGFVTPELTLYSLHGELMIIEGRN